MIVDEVVQKLQNRGYQIVKGHYGRWLGSLARDRKTFLFVGGVHWAKEWLILIEKAHTFSDTTSIMSRGHRQVVRQYMGVFVPRAESDETLQLAIVGAYRIAQERGVIDLLIQEHNEWENDR